MTDSRSGLKENAVPSQALIFEYMVPGTGADVCSYRQALDVKSHAPLQFALCLLLA